MAKTEQVRISTELAHDGRIIAAANGESLPDYVGRVLAEAISRDMPAAARKVAERAHQGAGDAPRSGRKKRE